MRWSPYAFVSPFFVLFVAFGLFPLIYTGWASLHTVELTAPTDMDWVGLRNYTRIFDDDFFWNAAKNTLTIGIISTVPQLLMAMGLAHILNYKLRASTFYRVAMLAPYATSIAAASLVFVLLFGRDYGMINWALDAVGINPVDWQNDKWPSQIAVSSIIIWRWTGYNTLIYLAAMQAIPQDLYESAALDGASRWQQFLHVTLPSLRPTILFTVVVSTIGASQVFGEPLLFDANKGASGGAEHQFQTLGLYLYEQGWINQHLGRLRHRLDHVPDPHHHRDRQLRHLAPAARQQLGARRDDDLDETPADAAPEPSKRSRLPKSARAGGTLHAGPIAYVILALFTIGSLFPLVWTAIAASRDNNRLAQTPPPFWFGSNLFKNLEIAWKDANLGEAFFNTTFVAGVSAATVVILSTIAGFAFAKLRFRGRGALMLLVIGTMMVPPQLSVIPLYMMVAKLDWTDQLQAVILPSLVSAFGVFFMRQYLIQALPDEIIEAARVDGASSWRVVWHIVFPAARPAMAVLGMLTFVQTWNDFLWPFLVLTQTGNPTVQVAVAGLGRGYTPDQSLIMAGALLGTLPLLIVFAIFGKQIVGGIMQGAVKG